MYVRVMQIQFAKCLYFTTSELSGIEMTLLVNDIMRFFPPTFYYGSIAVTLLIKNFFSYIYIESETRGYYITPQKMEYY